MKVTADCSATPPIAAALQHQRLQSKAQVLQAAQHALVHHRLVGP